MLQKMPHALSSGWSMIVRTYIIDNIISASIKEYSIDVVINIGSGLDTRPFRLEIPKNICWIEIDLPDIISYKKEN